MRKVKNLELDNINHYKNINVGDGVICVFKTDDLNNKHEVMLILKNINNLVRELEEEHKDIKLKFGSGASYGKTKNCGQGELISVSIDYAAAGANLANKYKIDGELRPWTIPIKITKDNEGSVDELIHVVQESSLVWSQKSSSGKNLWFSKIVIIMKQRKQRYGNAHRKAWQHAFLFHVILIRTN